MNVRYFNRDFNIIRDRYIACRDLKVEEILPKICDCCGLVTNQKEIDEQNKSPSFDCAKEVYNSTKDNLSYKETHQILRSCGFGPMFILYLTSD